MTIVYGVARPFVDEMLADEGQHRREIARVLNNAMRGQTNNTMQVTLSAGAASTIVLDPRISINTAAQLVAGTATAATEAASGNLYVVPSQGQVVINHTNNGVADRIFYLSLIG